MFARSVWVLIAAFSALVVVSTAFAVDHERDRRAASQFTVATEGFDAVFFTREAAMRYAERVQEDTGDPSTEKLLAALESAPDDPWCIKLSDCSWWCPDQDEFEDVISIEGARRALPK